MTTIPKEAIGVFADTYVAKCKEAGADITLYYQGIQAALEAVMPLITGWRPLETAPKDGTPFLAMISGLPYAAKYDEYGRFIWYWHSNMAKGDAYQKRIEDGKEIRVMIEHAESARYEICGHLWVNGFEEKPTHWMPLPTPPGATS